MALERFQQNTVEAAFRALTSDTGSRRFLIADEVGLGKTISSKSVAQRLRSTRDGPLNVVYLCPNLDIATQNLAKLKALDDTWESPPDRLSLAAAMTGNEKVTDFRLFSYTPDTSLPGWKAGQRGGKVEERQLIASLVSRVAPKFWRRLSLMDEQNGQRGHRQHFGWKPRAPGHLPVPFRAALERIMDLPGLDLDAELTAWLTTRDEDVAEFILRARAALALVALTNPATRPHFLILDEFHRYADLILPNERVLTGLKDERQRVQRRLIRTILEGDDTLKPPALLLMSATPYRLLRVDGTEIEASRYRSFIRLVRFLFGGEASELADAAAQRIARHHRALQEKGDREAALSAVKAAKIEVEAALRPIIARTERATTITDELFDRRSHAAVVQANDLRVFRHFASAVFKAMPAMSGWVTTLWSSVPYPAETLFDYKVSAAFKDLPKITSALPTTQTAHPLFRALVSPDASSNPVKPPPVDIALLGLPWIAPTSPWWKLGGRWAELSSHEKPVGKTLLFSRYVATPLAVSAVLSLDVHRRQKTTKTVQPYLRYEAKTPWPLIASFMPWPNLVEAIDPARNPMLRLGDVSEMATRALTTWLKNNNFKIDVRKGTDRKPWEMAFEIEMALNRTDAIVDALRHVHGLPTQNRKSWLKHNPRQDKKPISKDEVKFLASWLLSAPGMVIGRNLLRHQPDLLRDNNGLAEAFKFCWHELRPYLGQRVFGPTVLPRRKPKKRVSYPDALRTAIMVGGFEAVVDEHLAVMRLIGDGTPLEHLRQAFFGRAGRVRMRKAEMRKAERISVHAAVPYAGAERSKTKTTKDKKLRSDSLRRAFNSPFWPHVLATTSVGQEGLDFHVWCDRVIHWDLPRDPVDFEQREGRIARYASLCVRRSLAETHAAAGLDAKPGASPFWAIFESARDAKKEGIGLERWWSPPKHRPISITFDMRFSQNIARLRDLQEDLTRYRLALGQPEPGLFEDMVKHFELQPGEARTLALDLSAPDVTASLPDAVDQATST